jgi:hypothetical protein
MQTRPRCEAYGFGNDTETSNPWKVNDKEKASHFSSTRYTAVNFQHACRECGSQPALQLRYLLEE